MDHSRTRGESARQRYYRLLTSTHAMRAAYRHYRAVGRAVAVVTVAAIVVAVLQVRFVSTLNVPSTEMMRAMRKAMPMESRTTANPITAKRCATAVCKIQVLHHRMHRCRSAMDSSVRSMAMTLVRRRREATDCRNAAYPMDHATNVTAASIRDPPARRAPMHAPDWNVISSVAKKTATDNVTRRATHCSVSATTASLRVTAAFHPHHLCHLRQHRPLSIRMIAMDPNAPLMEGTNTVQVRQDPTACLCAVSPIHPTPLVSAVCQQLLLRRACRPAPVWNVIFTAATRPAESSTVRTDCHCAASKISPTRCASAAFLKRPLRPVPFLLHHLHRRRTIAHHRSSTAPDWNVISSAAERTATPKGTPTAYHSPAWPTQPSRNVIAVIRPTARHR